VEATAGAKGATAGAAAGRAAVRAAAARAEREGSTEVVEAKAVEAEELAAVVAEAEPKGAPAIAVARMEAARGHTPCSLQWRLGRRRQTCQ